MSHLNPNQHFDVESWRDRQIAQRTKDALAARDAAFAEKHADTPLRELALYLARCARTLRHSPAPCEVDGGAFIEQRFGSWDAALEMARLRPPAKEPKLKDTARYKREKAVQEPLFYEESARKKKAKRAKAAARHRRSNHGWKRKSGWSRKRKRLVMPLPASAKSRKRQKPPSRRCPAELPLSSHDGLNGDCQLSIRGTGSKPPLPPSSKIQGERLFR